MRIEGRSSATWLNTAIFAFCLTSGSFVAAAAQENPLIGCWKKIDMQSRYKDTISICLGENGELDGGIVDRGHGYDFWGRWEQAATNTIILIFSESNDKASCKFTIGQTTKLILKDCEGVDYSGEFGKVAN
jgi:hypothetical protein